MFQPCRLSDAVPCFCPGRIQATKLEALRGGGARVVKAEDVAKVEKVGGCWPRV